MMNSVDYLARDEAPSPVQQFWALSVQVQFYVIWPFLLLGIGFAARRLRSTWVAYATVLAAVILASLTYSVIETNRNSAATYFDPLARMWGFALGGILAVVLPACFDCVEGAPDRRMARLACRDRLRLRAACLCVLSRLRGPVADAGRRSGVIAGNSGTRHGVERLLAFSRCGFRRDIVLVLSLALARPDLLHDCQRADPARPAERIARDRGRAVQGLQYRSMAGTTDPIRYGTSEGLEGPCHGCRPSDAGARPVERVGAGQWQGGEPPARSRGAQDPGYPGGTNPMSLATAAMPEIQSTRDQRR